MRAFTGGQAARWELGHYGLATKVEIDRTGAGDWVSLSALQGRDWVREVQVSDTVDAATMTASVTLVRSQYLFNLSPLMLGSQLNVGGVLVTLYRKIRIWVFNATYGDNTLPGAPQLLFHGRIFSVDWSGEQIKIEARDFGGDLMDLFIENSKEIYGSDTTTVLAETVMQQILDAQAALLPAPVTLYSASGTGGTPFAVLDSPGWAIRQYEQDQMPTMAALQVIAQQIGWLIKYKYNASVGDFVLTWYDPDRANTTSLRTFTASQYTMVNECSLHLGDIRNYVRVVYTDSSGVKQTEVASDAGSITSFGRKFMQIAEEATSQIDTFAEATSMAQAAVADLAIPIMTHSVEMPLFWPVDIGDVYTFAANGAHYDTDQKLAVFSYTHTIGPSKSGTSMTLRGKPSGGVRTWFDREARLSRKQFGVVNLSVDADEANAVPNGAFVQYTRG